MIELTILHGGKMHFNIFHILTVESIPETKVMLTTGHYYLVSETPGAIREKIRNFLNSCVTVGGMQELE